MAQTEIMTVKGLRHAIKTCKEVNAVVRFGVSEAWVKLAKTEALYLIENFNDSDTPDDHEMYTGRFGMVENGILYIG